MEGRLVSSSVVLMALERPADFDLIDAPEPPPPALHLVEPEPPHPVTAEAAGGGSFVDDRTGQWADVATLERSEDIISLVASLLRLNRREAAKFLAALLQIDWRPPQ
jgi:hypothetical protein